jgi:4-amino-4-deoxy-L-arabinose transferase-like glycosyltransferase
MGCSLPQNKSSSFNAWLFFLIFMAVNIYFSFGFHQWGGNLWLGLWALFLPVFGLLARRKFTAEKEEPSFSSRYPDPPLWLWSAFVLLLLFTRFYHLETFPAWPVSDEGSEAFTAMQPFEKWGHQLLLTDGQNEPLFFWGMALFFKAFEPSLFSIRLYPALYSLATVMAGYWAARQFFSKPTAFLISFVLAFNFWFFSCDKLCMNINSILLFQCLALGCLGIFFKTSTPLGQWSTISLLGVVTGLGIYTNTPWP